jgi:hypothetical protein
MRDGAPRIERERERVTGPVQTDFFGALGRAWR